MCDALIKAVTGEPTARFRILTALAGDDGTNHCTAGGFDGNFGIHRTVGDALHRCLAIGCETIKSAHHLLRR